MNLINSNPITHLKAYLLSTYKRGDVLASSDIQMHLVFPPSSHQTVDPGRTCVQ